LATATVSREEEPWVMDAGVKVVVAVGVTVVQLVCAAGVVAVWTLAR
jgi:hypothetical protein